MARMLLLTLLIALTASIVVGPGLATSAARDGSVAAGPFDGRWNATATRAQLLRKIPAAVVDRICGPAPRPCPPARVEFANGRFRLYQLDPGTAPPSYGTFRVAGNLVRFVFTRGVGVKAGTVAECAWSVYRNRLVFKAVPARPCRGWDSGPFVRAS
jgi:hypothetical protein